jgi:hypothetical protein
LIVGEQGRPETNREFLAAGWHLKQMEDLLTICKVNGQHFTLSAHGDGMFAYILRVLGSTADLSMLVEEE